MFFPTLCALRCGWRHAFGYFGAMRRGFFLLLSLLVGLLSGFPVQDVAAQKKRKKGNYYKAEGYFLNRKLSEAQDEIDRVLLSPKRAAKSSTWYLRGQIYEAIYFGNDEELKKSVEDPAMEAIDSYLKTIELEGRRSEMFDNARKSVHGLCDHFIALGAEAYKLEDFLLAYRHFKKTLKVRPADSVCLLFGGVSAQYAAQPEEALANYYKLKELYDIPKMAFWGIIEVEMSQNRDTTKVMSLLKEGQALFPEDLDFVKRELDILIKQGRSEEAEKKLKETVRREPENTAAQLNLAIMYDNRSIESTAAGRVKEAEEHLKVAEGYYQKCAEI